MLTRQAKKEAIASAIENGHAGMTRLTGWGRLTVMPTWSPSRRDIESAIVWFERAQADLQAILDGR